MSYRALGRLPSQDDRDQAFPLMAAVEEEPEYPRRWRYWWDRGWWGDQGRWPHCVAFAWLHCLEDGPTTRSPFTPGAGPAVNPRTLYAQAQLVDEWPGTDYDGTSVRAGAKVLQRMGYIGAYRWAWTLTELVDAVLRLGPVVVGTWWYAGMDRPRPSGFINVTGPRRGGHAYVVNGVNRDRGILRLKNSWGRRWGRDGRAWINFEDMERLMREDGEVCVATEIAHGG